MLPTIDNDIVVVNKFSYRVLGEKPKKGDVVVAVLPPPVPSAAPAESTPENLKVVCKRVAAVEGESVSYLSKGKMQKKVVPSDHVWLLGDNSSLSIDSRTYGAVPVKNVKAKVVMTLYPNFKMVK